MAQAPSIPVETVGLQYATVAASQTDQLLKNLGGQKGDFLAGVLVIPTTTAAGNVSIKDGTTSITLYNTGTLVDLKPFYIQIGINAVNPDGWKITTGANVAAIAIGRFS